jgi:hypothetical protein
MGLTCLYVKDKAYAKPGSWSNHGGFRVTVWTGTIPHILIAVVITAPILELGNNFTNWAKIAKAEG